MNPQQLLKNKIDKLASELSESSSIAGYKYTPQDALFFVKGAQSLVPLVESLVLALRYNRNEMSYRIHQIEGGYNIPLTGEMHSAVKQADEALTKFDSFVKVEK